MTQIDEPNLDELIDKYRADIMLATQGINSENEQYKDSSINVAALSTINLKSDLEALIATQVQEAYKKGFLDGGMEVINGRSTQ